MRHNVGIGMLALVLSSGLAACNRADSPTEVRHDVAEAQKDATRQLNAARSDADKIVDQKERDLTNSAANADYDIRLAKADGDYKVALQKCKALSGSVQKYCKDKAEAMLTSAQANAKVAVEKSRQP